MPNYGMNAYFEAAADVLGEVYHEQIKAIWGFTDSARDSKLTNLLLMEVVKYLRNIDQSLRIVANQSTGSIVAKASPDTIASVVGSIVAETNKATLNRKEPTVVKSQVAVAQ